MSVVGDRAKMMEWANLLRMPGLSLPPERTFILECNKVKIAQSSGKSKSDAKRRTLSGVKTLSLRKWSSQVVSRHLILASDILVLSQCRKKSTLSRKKLRPLIIPFVAGKLSIKHEQISSSVTFRYRDKEQEEQKEIHVQIFLPPERYAEIIAAVRKVASQTKCHVSSQGSQAAQQKAPAAPPPCPALKAERLSMPTASASSKDRQKTLEMLKLKKLPAAEVESMENEAQTVEVFAKMESWAAGLHDRHASQCVEVLREIFETERVYVRDLNTLVTEYIIPLRQAKSRLHTNDVPLISPEDLQTIFNNTENILKVNQELLTSIAKGVRQVSDKKEVPTVSEIAGVYASAFVQIIPFLRMYSIYCHHYASGLERLSSLRQSNKELDAFLLRRESRKKNLQFSIQSLLIKPVQRICKYPLLFRELLKHMNREMKRKGDDHFENYVGELEKTAKEVEKLAATVNEKVSEAESQSQLLEMYLELGGPHGHENLRELIQPSRRYRSTWLVKMKEAPFASHLRQNYRLYLFNDLIIFAKCTGNFGTLGKINAKTLTGTKRKTSTKLKVTHYIALIQCSIKSVHAVDAEGMAPLQITRVYRQTTKAAAGSTGRLTTAIEKFEVWCTDKAEADALKREIEENMEKIIEAEETREVANKKSTSRAWASRNRTKRTSAWRGTGSGKNIVQESKKNDSDSQTKDYRSLDDIKSKYSFKPREIPHAPGRRIVLDINFPKGPLGLALENLDESDGIFVACVAATSVAEKGGLAVGDRLVSIAGEILPPGTTWEVVVDIVKKLPRPLKMTFERTQKTVAVQRMRNRKRHG